MLTQLWPGSCRCEVICDNDNGACDRLAIRKCLVTKGWRDGGCGRKTRSRDAELKAKETV